MSQFKSIMKIQTLIKSLIWFQSLIQIKSAVQIKSQIQIKNMMKIQSQIESLNQIQSQILVKSQIRVKREIRVKIQIESQTRVKSQIQTESQIQIKSQTWVNSQTRLKSQIQIKSQIRMKSLSLEHLGSTTLINLIQFQSLSLDHLGPRSWRQEPMMIRVRSLASFYELGDILGSGAFGTVRKALRKSDNKEVAIKQIENDRYVPGCSKPMIKEVEFMLMMKRPPLCKYVIEMYEWFNEPGYISIVLEYPKHSEDLRNYVRNCGKLDEHLAKCLLRQIILAVKHCFGKGIAHNDLHLGNILVNTMTLEIKLIDFGCAYKVCAQDCDRAELASTRAICCLLVYMVTGNMKTYFAAKVSCSFPLAASLTSDCRDLIDKCLRQSLTLDELLQHDWMK
ncbi:serine/threonine-protein kinase pim-2-like isoform X5 [Danio rerio]|uniref:Serine/threonine-protein kinase pim-2-like isoform X5 n=1 Tax=Danio rerio TaxID=7955 RepID=A0AC58IHB9_DANRE